MANVLFKRGTQSNLDTLRTNKAATDGTFYMTSDSHRLYVGISSGDAVPVNEGITVVNNIGQLPDVSTYEQKRQHTGQFYYIDGTDKDKNILCVFNGQKWVQINSNSNTYVSGVAYTVEVNDNVAAVKYTVTNSDGSAPSDSFSIAGGNGILVSKSDKKVTITGDTYELGGAVSDDGKTATVSLTSENTDNDTSVKLVSKNANLTMRKSAADTIELTVKDTVLDSVSSGNGTDADDTSTNKEGIYVTVSDSSGKSGTARINPRFRVGSDNSGYEYVKIVNGDVALPVYSKNEIDAKMRTLDAMRYRGTLGSGCTYTSLTAIQNQLELGDTFLIGAAGGYECVINNKTYKGKKGDMFIVNGDEIPNTGHIDPSTLTVDIIPSGDDAAQDTTYTVVPNANGFTIAGSTGANAGSVKYTGDNNITISVAADAGDSKQANVSITHKQYTTLTSTPGTGDVYGHTYNASTDLSIQSSTGTIEIPVVDTIIRDGAGHVKGVKVKKYRLTDTNGHMSQADTKVSGSHNDAKTVATVVQTIGFSTSKGGVSSANATFAVSSSSLQVSAQNSEDKTTTNISLDMVWGSF